MKSKLQIGALVRSVNLYDSIGLVTKVVRARSGAYSDVYVRWYRPADWTVSYNNKIPVKSYLLVVVS